MRRIMYVENKDGWPDGEGRIGWVEMSRTGRSYVYRGRRLAKTKSGYKFNCFDEDNGDPYWVSGPARTVRTNSTAESWKSMTTPGSSTGRRFADARIGRTRSSIELAARPGRTVTCAAMD